MALARAICVPNCSLITSLNRFACSLYTTSRAAMAPLILVAILIRFYYIKLMLINL